MVIQIMKCSELARNDIGNIAADEFLASFKAYVVTESQKQQSSSTSTIDMTQPNATNSDMAKEETNNEGVDERDSIEIADVDEGNQNVEV